MMTTYLDEKQYNLMTGVTDRDLNNLLKETRKDLPNLYIDETLFTKKKLFKNNVRFYKYTIYNRMDAVEAQILLVPGEYVSKETAMAYLYGLRHGLDEGLKLKR